LDRFAIVTGFSERCLPLIKQCIVSCCECIKKFPDPASFHFFIYECNWVGDPYTSVTLTQRPGGMRPQVEKPVLPFSQKIQLSSELLLPQNVKLTQLDGADLRSSLTWLPDMLVYQDFCDKYMDEFDFVLFCHDDIFFNEQYDLFTYLVKQFATQLPPVNLVGETHLECFDYVSARIYPHFVFAKVDRFRELELSWVNEFPLFADGIVARPPYHDGGASLLASYYRKAREGQIAKPLSIGFKHLRLANRSVGVESAILGRMPKTDIDAAMERANRYVDLRMFQETKTCKCNKQGFLTYESRDLVLPHTYSFAHYCDEPTFTRMNHECEADFLCNGPNSIEYTKRYTYFEDSLNLRHTISDQKGLIWDISLLSENKDESKNVPYTFGIAVLIGNLPIFLPNGDMAEQIINYSKMWYPLYERQSIIDLPIIMCPMKNGQYMTISFPLDTTVQLYRYLDGQDSYLKIAFRSDAIDKASIRFDPCTGPNQNLTDLYKTLYPHTTDQIDFWKTAVEKLRSLYGVEVAINQSFDRWDIKGDAPSQPEITAFINLLWAELLLYSPEVFGTVKVKRICLLTNLKRDDEFLYGAVASDHFLFNISSGIPDYQKRIAIHHEIFHSLEMSMAENVRQQFIAQWQETGCCPLLDSLRLPRPPSEKEDGPNEDRADFFAMLQTNSEMLRDASKTNPATRRKVELLLAVIRENWPNLIRLDPNKELTIEHDIAKNISNAQLETLYKPQTPQYRDTVMTGLGGYWIEATRSLFERNEIPIKVEPLSNDLTSIHNEYQMKEIALVYITCSPLEYCAQQFTESGEPVEQSMARWLVAAREAIRLSLPVLRYEDVASLSRPAILRFLKEAGIEKTEFKFTENIPLCRYDPQKVPDLRRIWQLHRRENVVVALGYLRASIEG
jgi:hypothetical protein